MSGLDIEGVLAEHDRAEGRRDGRIHCCCGWASDPLSLVTAVPRADQYRAHVAAVLREQIAAAMLDAWDRGWAARAQSSHGRYSLDHLDDPYRAALAAQVAPSRVPGEES